MRAALSCGLLLAGILLGACGATPAAAPEPGAAGYGYLVVRAGEDPAHPSTDWIDADGTLRGHADGAFVGVANRLYRFQSRSERVTLRTCDAILGAPENEEGDPSGTVASAMLSGVGRESLLLIRPVVDAALQEFAHHEEEHRLLAALGTRIVVESRRARNACSAHDDLSVTVRTFDFATGAEVLVLGDERTARAARGPEALEQMRRLDPNRTAGCLSSDVMTAEYRTSIPTFVLARGSGHVAARDLFVVAVSFACGTLEAPTSAYEWGTWLDGVLPAGYETETIPAPVLDYAAAHGAVGLTWLAVEDARLGDAFALSAD